MTDRPPHRLARGLTVFFVATLFLSIGGGGIAAISAILSDGHRENESLLLATVMTPVIGVLYSCLGLINVHAVRVRRPPVAGLMSIVVLTAAAAAWLWLVYGGPSPWKGSSEDVAQIAASLTIPSVVMTLAIRFVLLETRSLAVRILTWAVIVNLLAIGAAAIVLVWTTWWHSYDIVGVGLSMWIAVTLMSLVLVPGVVRAGGKRRPAPKESIPSRLTLEMTCPRCTAEQRLPMGLTACRACRFAMMIEVDEPRCACGYLLYRLEGESCPECGAPIPDAQRWSTWNRRDTPDSDADDAKRDLRPMATDDADQ